MRAHFLVPRQLAVFSLTPHMVKGAIELSGGLSTCTLTPLWKASLHDLSSSHSLYLLIPSQWLLGFQHIHFGRGTQTCSPCLAKKTRHNFPLLHQNLALYSSAQQLSLTGSDSALKVPIKPLTSFREFLFPP